MEQNNTIIKTVQKGVFFCSFIQDSVLKVVIFYETVKDIK